jgi:hypothetical protein
VDTYCLIGSSDDKALLAEAFDSLLKNLQDDDSNVQCLAFIAIEQLLRRGMFSGHITTNADGCPGDPCCHCKLVGDAFDMLKSPKEDVRRIALDIITMVVSHGRFQCGLSNIHAEHANATEDWCGQVVELDKLTSLSEMLESSSWILRCCAVEGIVVLVESSKTQDYVLGLTAYSREGGAPDEVLMLKFFGHLVHMLLETTKGIHLEMMIILATFGMLIDTFWNHTGLTLQQCISAPRW